MSNMLEQAIVDAEALREAALKSAEASVLEKYSEQIKEAVENLLEQPEDEMDDFGLDTAEEPEEEMADDVPMASTAGAKLCPCHDDDEEIEIPLDDLLKQLDAGDEMAPEVDREAAAIELTGMTPPEEEEELPLEEELDLSEESLADIIEQLTVDIHPQKSGWAGTPQAMVDLAEEELLALEQDSKVKEERAAMRKAVSDLQEANKALEEKLNQAIEERDELRDLSLRVKDTLEETNLQNARLLYTNKVLIGDSLNERHKNRIADAISKAETVEEAKIIFETLQSATGSTKSKSPESLSEAVNKPSSTLILSRRKTEAKTQDNPAVDRWKVLAGLNNNS